MSIEQAYPLSVVPGLLAVAAIVSYVPSPFIAGFLIMAVAIGVFYAWRHTYGPKGAAAGLSALIFGLCVGVFFATTTTALLMGEQYETSDVAPIFAVSMVAGSWLGAVCGLRFYRKRTGLVRPRPSVELIDLTVEDVPA